MGAIISILFFLVPLGFFLFNALRVRMERGPRGITGEHVSAKVPKPARRPARKARARSLDEGVNCGRHFTHFLLTITGSRGSCSACAALDSRVPVPIRKQLEEEPPEPGAAAAAPQDEQS